MKKKKIIIIAIIAALAISIGLFLYFSFRDKNRLTILDKEWINSNKQNVINIAVLNNVNVFGEAGEGVFFEFLKDFNKKYDLTTNANPYNYGNNASGINFSVKKTLSENDQVIYRDHYVLVASENVTITNIKDLNSQKIAVLTSDLSYIQGYIPGISFVPYDNGTIMMDDLGSVESTVKYAIVSQNMFLDDILENNYHIVYHFSDIPLFYTLTFKENDRLASIMRKFSAGWLEESFDSYYQKYNLKLFLNNLNISEKDKDILTNKIYNYASISSTPYEIIMSNNYGGIMSLFLEKFSNFSEVEFKYSNYKSVDAMEEAADNGNVDLFFNYYNIENPYVEVKTLVNPTIAVIAPRDNSAVVHSLNSLRGKEVYVQKDSNIHRYLKELSYINIKTYDKEKELRKLNSSDSIIVLDLNAFEYYQFNELDNYSLRYTQIINKPYTFRINGDATFTKLFSSYIETIPTDEVVYEGVENYKATKKTGSFFAQIAKYGLVTIALGGTILFFYLKSKKKVKINTKIRKEDKLRFIDMLTSLKNRNYLNENIRGWNNNTIYPQTAIIVDLNSVKYINDTYGTAEGDNQIKAAANILIKTQIDNTDIIRTDGNEFLIYMVGFEEKRTISYIRKLYKEFNNLPYEYGAAIGYSMRTDDLKTIEDVINEATLDMRSKKEARDSKA